MTILNYLAPTQSRERLGHDLIFGFLLPLSIPYYIYPPTFNLQSRWKISLFNILKITQIVPAHKKDLVLNGFSSLFWIWGQD